MAGRHIFIDENGNDNNDGSSEAPIVTSKRFHEIAVKQGANVSFSVKGSPTYCMRINAELAAMGYNTL